MTSRTKLVLLLSVMVLFAVGCGGGDDSTASSPVTKAEFIRKADLICEREDIAQPRALEAYRPKHEKELKRVGPVRYEATVVEDLTLPSAKKQIKEIESLKPPDGEAKKVDAIIAGWKAAVRKGEKHPYLVARWDWPGREPFYKINEIAIRYGFVGCEDLR